MLYNNKAISGVVATVLLILITVIAASIIFGITIPFTNDSFESTSCFSYRDYFKFMETEGFNCYNETDENEYILSITTENNEKKADNVKGLLIRFIIDDNAETVRIEENLNESEVVMYGEIGEGKLKIPSSTGEFSTLSYLYKSDKLFESAELFAILKNNDLCEKSDEIIIIKC